MMCNHETIEVTIGSWDLEVGKNILSKEAKEDSIEERLYRFDDMKMDKHEKV